MPFQLLCVLKVRRGYEKKTALLKHSDDIENTIRKQNCKEIVLNTLNKFHIFNMSYCRCPKTVENFCVHSRNGYYNGHTFHRIIKVGYANCII